MESDNKICMNCEHWQPRYYGVGECTKTNMPNAKLWVTEKNASLLTVASFGCDAFQVKEPPAKEMI